MMNCNWRTKLKINKTFVKGSITKNQNQNQNQKNRELKLKYQKQGPSNTGGEQMPSDDKQLYLLQQTPHQEKENVVMLLMTL